MDFFCTSLLHSICLYAPPPQTLLSLSSHHFLSFPSFLSHSSSFPFPSFFPFLPLSSLFGSLPFFLLSLLFLISFFYFLLSSFPFVSFSLHLSPSFFHPPLTCISCPRSFSVSLPFILSFLIPFLFLFSFCICLGIRLFFLFTECVLTFF